MRREKLEKLKKRTLEILNTEVFSFKEAYWVISSGVKFVHKNTANLIKSTAQTLTKSKLKKEAIEKKSLKTTFKKKKKSSEPFKFERPFKNLFRTEIMWNNLDFKELNVYFNQLKKTTVSFKKLGGTTVSIKNQNCLHPDFIMTRNISDFEQIIIWRDYLPGFSTTARLYDTGLYHQFNLQEKEASIPCPDITQINKDEIAIKNDIKILEELVKIKTNTKIFNASELYRFPVQLEPCGIGFFSTSQLEEFKALLANSQKTKPYNVEIVNIYDNFNIELYLKIMQSPNTNKFNCFLSPEKLSYNKFRQFYLVVGKRKDNNASITALYPKTET